MSSESKQWLLEVVLMLLALIALASAPARGTAAHDTIDVATGVAATHK